MAIWVLFVPAVAVVDVGVPVKAGEARLAFKLSAVVTKAVVAIAVVLSAAVWVVATVPVGRVGVPVKVGLASGAFSARSAEVTGVAHAVS